MKSKILEYINKSKIRYTTYIKNDEILYSQINQSIILDIDLKEKCYLILNDLTTVPVCICGNSVKFIGINEGYRKFCSISCSEKTKDRIIASQAFYKSKENKKTANNKLKQTMLEKYGVEHNSKLQFVLDKRENTWSKKYGVNNPAKIHYSLETYEILNSKEKLFNFITKKTTAKECALSLNIDNTTLYNYIHQYDFIEYLEFKNNSYFETDVINFLKSIDVKRIVKNDRSLISPKQIDIYLPDYGLCLELNGLYWHSERKIKDKNYHYNKTIAIRNKSLKLFHIWDSEWNNANKKIIWQEKIKHTLHKSKNSIGGRHFEIHDNPTNYYSFLNTHHLQGYCPAKIQIGGYYLDKLMAVMAFNCYNNKFEMVRWCVNGNYPGLFSKMLSYAVKKYNIKYVYTYSDNRYSDGNIYYQTGFSYEKEILPTYYYTKTFTELWHRTNFMKSKIQKKFKIDIDNKTEKQLMNDLGYTRIWDAGKLRFSKSF